MVFPFFWGFAVLRSRHLGPLAVLPLLLIAWNFTVSAEPDSTAAFPKTAEPKTHIEQQASFVLPDGLQIEMVAVEPLVESPVYASFDEYGRLWVVEMRDYPNGPAEGEKPGGRIKILTDNSGNGVFDTVDIFADNLLFANSLMHWNGGVIVTMAPKVVFMKDTNGDSRADYVEELFEGFTAGNPQLRVSHPILGHDGWVYLANGLRGGEIRRANQPDAEPIAIGGKDFRFNPITMEAEAIPGLGQFGNTFDARGQRFVCDNRKHLRHVVFPQDPSIRNPLLIVPAVMQDTNGPIAGPPPPIGKVHPISRTWTTSNLHEGEFTASCGVFIDAGGLLPKPFAGMAFTCEPTGNLIHGEILEPVGSTYQSRPWKEGQEFLATKDEWFRPVSMTQAPDGSLLGVDMYRAVIEHPEFMPAELKNRPDLVKGRNKGRIWRIAPKGTKPLRKPTFVKTPAQWLENLASKNAWIATTAQNNLMNAEQDDETVSLVLASALRSEQAAKAIRAAWILQSWGKIDRKIIEKLAKTANSPEARAEAARLFEMNHADGDSVPEALLNLADDDNPRVRFQAALSLGAWDGDAVIGALAKVAVRDVNDGWTRLAVASSVKDQAGQLMSQLLNDESFHDQPSAHHQAMIKQLADLVGAKQDTADSSRVIQQMAGLIQDEPKNAPLALAGVTGLAEGTVRRGQSFQVFLKKVSAETQAEWAGLIDRLTPIAANQDAAQTARLSAVRLLSFADWAQAKPLLMSLIGSTETPQELRNGAVRSLAAHAGEEVDETLLGLWKQATPALRIELAEAMLRSTTRINTLLDAIENGQIPAGDIDPARTRRLTGSRNKEIASRATKLLKENLPADRKEVMAKYQQSLEINGDAKRGLALFEKNCAACHKIAGVGNRVGPDISDTRTKTPQMLLTDILNPNAAIDGNYVTYVIDTVDGKSFQGIITSETASSITLARDGSQTDTILRDDIEEFRSTGKSLMPDGLEKNISVAEMADLIRFLKDWRYLEMNE